MFFQYEFRMIFFLIQFYFYAIDTSDSVCAVFTKKYKIKFFMPSYSKTVHFADFLIFWSRILSEQNKCYGGRQSICLQIVHQAQNRLLSSNI